MRPGSSPYYKRNWTSISRLATENKGLPQTKGWHSGDGRFFRSQSRLRRRTVPGKCVMSDREARFHEAPIREAPRAADDSIAQHAHTRRDRTVAALRRTSPRDKDRLYLSFLQSPWPEQGVRRSAGRSPGSSDGEPNHSLEGMPRRERGSRWRRRPVTSVFSTSSPHNKPHRMPARHLLFVNRFFHPDHS